VLSHEPVTNLFNERPSSRTEETDPYGAQETAFVPSLSFLNSLDILKGKGSVKVVLRQKLIFYTNLHLYIPGLIPCHQKRRRQVCNRTHVAPKKLNLLMIRVFHEREFLSKQ